MGSDNNLPDQSEEQPEDAIVVRQVQYAWLWSSMPLMAILAALLLFGLFPDPIMPSVIFLIILVPKYFMWRRTNYTLTKDRLIYQRGGLTSTRKYQIPAERLKNIRTKYGIFGRALGYQHVEIVLDNGAVATLAYVPIEMDVAEYFQEMIDEREPNAEDTRGVSDSDHDDAPRKYDPDASKYEPDDSSDEKPPQQ